MNAEIDDSAIEQSNDSASDAEEEDECRVCRGPAEEGHPLFSPCKCSGSIGLVHQDCLMSWLEVTRKDGRCELCKTKFRFDPQYAENTPDRLPASEVVVGLTSRFVARWLPLALRILIAASLWLIVAPLMTGCLYHGWMHRPSSIVTRMKRELVWGDIVSGAIVAAIVIVSFLSLMSFADFLRGHWHPQQGDRNGQNRRRNGGVGLDDDDSGANNEEDPIVEDSIVRMLEARRVEAEVETAGESAVEEYRTQGGSPESEGFFFVGNDTGARSQREDLDSLPQPEAAAAAIEFEGRNDIDDENNVDDNNVDFGAALNMDFERDGAQAPNVDRNELPFDPLDVGIPDDQVDMEINVALDELLGLRGPVSALLRNLLWLLAFNATYLGIFTFIPKTVGSTIYSGVFNTTSCQNLLKSIPLMYSDNENQTTILNSLETINAVSVERNTTFRLPDTATILLGYLSIGAMTVILRFIWVLSQKLQERYSVEGTRLNDDDGVNPQNEGPRVARRGAQHLGEQEIELNAGEAIGVVLDGTVAIVKVGILLCLKMFVLPLVLGLFLDASTLSLFNHQLSDRLLFAGSDLFSFVLLHWVAGITFMLLVTVFLLQLREVMHPEILARLIRPQEPQPDLLGNLMNESVVTHMKRMILSLAIYAPLLVLHITLPVKLLAMSGTTRYFSFFELKLWHIVIPEMQVPIELVFFHLSMLALLERYKNSIGSFQHLWMKIMCRRMGLTEYLLPMETESFELIGSKELFSRGDENGDAASIVVDACWYKLATNTSDIDGFVDSSVVKEISSSETSCKITGEVKTNGARVVKSIDFIKLPAIQSPRIKGDETEFVMLPTSIGQYRLNLVNSDSTDHVPIIEFWKEVRGSEISRPPEGWDDLGAGGAFVQCRWAWGKERMSLIERGVAKRSVFRDQRTKKRPIALVLRAACLMILSWVAITCAVFGFIGIPIGLGRTLYHIFRLSTYIHDPLAFVIGSCLFFPVVSLLSRELKLGDGQFGRRFHAWLLSFRPPTRQKFTVLVESVALWSIVAPTVLGISYEMTFVKSTDWFAGDEALLDLRAWFTALTVGSVMLNSWAFLSYFNVFTKLFWANVGNGMLEPPIDENGNAIPPRQNPQAGPRRGDWQGQDGRIARVFNIWVSALMHWEWEKVDRVKLLDEFARPITRHLASSLVGSVLSFQLIVYLAKVLAGYSLGAFQVPLATTAGMGRFRMITFRVCMTLHILFQLCSAFRAQLERWFAAAHGAARDDRYLIGEVLMNYEED